MLRRDLFHRAAARDLRVLAPQAARRVFVRRLSSGVRGHPLPQELRLFDRSSPSRQSSSACCSSCRPPTSIRLTPAAAPAGGRVHHAHAAGHPGDHHRLRLSPPLQFVLVAAADVERAGDRCPPRLQLRDAGAPLHVPRRRHRHARHRRPHADRGRAEPRRQLADDHAPRHPAQRPGRRSSRARS